ncbi:MAG: VWA domain-containing protein [Candidatus Lokiarchaeota archaeon]|nr:VWA domain-containing protein [Candidatus Lokiarchaeota archaeon]
MNVIDPFIGGVLLTGHQGTGKSTAVRALVDILPEIDVVKGCPFNCDPSWPEDKLCDSCKALKKEGKLPAIKRKMEVVNLPLGATEEMITGTLNIERVIREGARALQPGLLAKANRQILYVDEINLLSDHLVDLLLDAAASGVNIVEREGVSFMHPAKFMLVGSMNPEEGELRPQISDRLGLAVNIVASKDPKERARISKMVLQFTADTDSVMRVFKDQQDKLRVQVQDARDTLNEVVVPDGFYEGVSKLIAELGIISHRADIVFVRCARAHAALQGRKVVGKDDFKVAFDLALSHRLRNLAMLGEQHKDVKDRALDIYAKIEEAIENEDAYKPGNQEGPLKHSKKQQDKMEITPLKEEHPELPEPEEEQRTDSSEEKLPEDAQPGEGMRVHYVPGDEAFKVEIAENVKRTNKKVLDIMRILKQQKYSASGISHGKRVKIISRQSGRYVTFRNPPPRTRPHSIALDATLKYSIIDQGIKGAYCGPGTPASCTVVPLPLNLPKSCIKERVFEFKAPLSMYFVLDASASMSGTLFQMKQVIDSLHQEGYKKKDKVAVVMFRGKNAHVIQKPSVNLEAISKKLENIQGTSYTPLAEGIEKVLDMIRVERIKDPNAIPVMIIVSDCGANISKKYPGLVAQVQEDYELIVKEMDEIVTKMGKVRNMKTLVVLPKKSYALRNVGINPFVQTSILESLKAKARAVIFEFSGVDDTRILLKEMA